MSLGTSSAGGISGLVWGGFEIRMALLVHGWNRGSVPVLGRGGFAPRPPSLFGASTLGGLAISISGGDGSDSWTCDLARIACSRLRSAYFICPMDCAFTFFRRASARLLAAAIIVSAGVTVGLVIYLCLKNIVPEILVVRVVLVQTFQHL